MGDVTDSTVICTSEGKAYGRQREAPTGLSFSIVDYCSPL